MYLTQLLLQNFRSYTKTNFSFTPSINVIVGPNTAGKTNILEAIYLLATGKSYRAQKETEMLKIGTEVARVNGEIQKETKEKLEMVLTSGLVSGKIAPRKKYLVNGVAKRQIDFSGILRAVLFSPTDLELITNSPSLRRRYLDFVLIQSDRDYRRALGLYEKGMRQRNRLLERIRDEGISRSQLSFWDDLLIKNGRYLSQRRQEYINFINYELQLGRLLKNEELMGFSLVYDPSEISHERLMQYAHEEIAAATTLVGPHRDDWKIKKLELRIKNKELRNKLSVDRAGFDGSEITSDGEGKQGDWYDVALYGSRGEQRMAILWLKLSELEYLEQKTKERPILLLDDIFSELDDVHRRLIMEVVPKQQTIITTTDVEHIDKRYLEDVNVLDLTEK